MSRFCSLCGSAVKESACNVRDLGSIPGLLFLLWLRLFILSGVISPLFSSSILGTYWPWKFIFQCHIFLSFHTVHEVLKARTLKWFAIPFTSGSRFFSAHSFIELDKAVIQVISLVSFL